MEPIVLQKQIMENAEHVQSFVNSLKDWEEEMQKKEEELLSLKKSETISLDEKLSRHEAADVHKNTGNDFVKKGKWESAILQYTKAIELYPDDPAYYGNRSYCYLQQNNLTAAEQDCNRALDLKPDYVKVALRRANVRRQLGNIHGAAKDYNLVLVLQPKNTTALKEYEEIYPELKAYCADIGIILPEFVEMNPSALKDDGIDEAKPFGAAGNTVNKNKNQKNIDFLLPEKNVLNKSKRKQINGGAPDVKEKILKDYNGDYAELNPIKYISPHKRSKLALRRIIIDDIYMETSDL